jgi:hypothetical protein
MNCELMMEWMQRFVDEDLTQTEQEVLMKHVTQCPECAASFERLQLLSAELAHLHKITPPYSIVDSILPKLMELDAQQAAIKAAVLPTTKHGKKAIFSWKIGAGFVAAAIFFSLIAVNLMPNTNKTASDKMLMENQSISASPAAAFENPGSALDSTAAKEEAKAQQPTADNSNSEDKLTATFDQAIDGLKGDAKEEKATESGQKPDKSKSSRTASPTVSTDATNDTSKNQKTAPATSPSPAPAPQATEPIGHDKRLMVPRTSLVNPSVQTLASEDGNFIGLVERQIVQVQTPDGNRIYTSSVQWKPTDSIQFIQWLDNSRLVYEVKMEDGLVKRYIIDPILKTEQEQINN